MSRPTVPWGSVVDFDADIGLGTVRADDGARVPFHCTAITDGSRDIAVGTRVRIELGPGHGGRWEARGVEPLPDA